MNRSAGPTLPVHAGVGGAKQAFDLADHRLSVQAQIPLTGFEASPLVSDSTSGEPTLDSFSCGGEVPGYAVNCVGSTKVEYEKVVGEFAIGTPVCAEPRVDPLLTVTYAYLEKGVLTQAISGRLTSAGRCTAPPTVTTAVRALIRS
jgi:hypothetical protein